MGNIFSYFETQTPAEIDRVESGEDCPSSPEKKQKTENCAFVQEKMNETDDVSGYEVKCTLSFNEGIYTTTPISSTNVFIPKTRPDQEGIIYGSMNGVDGYIGMPGEDPNKFYPIGSECNGILGPTGNAGVSNKCTGGGPYYYKDFEEEGKPCLFCDPTGNEGISNLDRAQEVSSPTGAHFVVCHEVNMNDADIDKSTSYGQEENTSSTEENVVETLPSETVLAISRADFISGYVERSYFPPTKLSVMAEEFVPASVNAL